MKNILTFIVPVRHQDNAKDWGSLKRNLAITASSIAAQDSVGWRAIVVANYGADLPDLPDGFEIKWVDFPPNPMHDIPPGVDRAPFYEAFRLDKGLRVLAGMLHAGQMGHVMIVDDDDFVSRRLTGFVAANCAENGWVIRRGFVWSGGNVLYLHKEFSGLCGTSHIVRSDLYGLPSDMGCASQDYIKSMLGSHVQIESKLSSIGFALADLPFPGAVYRVGHAGAHSGSSGVISQYFRGQGLYRRPIEFVRRLSRLRWRGAFLREEFFNSK